MWYPENAILFLCHWSFALPLPGNKRTTVRMLSALKQRPAHVAVIVVCLYPMVKIATGGYDEVLGISPPASPPDTISTETKDVAKR